MNIPQNQSPSGVLLIDKDPGFTSHNAVALCRRILGTRKVGHCGTLDPMATGLLLIVVGKATRLQDRLMGADKVYTGTVQLGVETNSYDAEGEVVARASIEGLREEAVREVFARFRGSLEQVPPMYSAIKINGVPCYKLARKGVEIERKSRQVCVYDSAITRLDISRGELDFSLHCSKGFYVRSFAHDLGVALGCGAHLTALRRTHIGEFDVEQALSVPQLKTAPPEVVRRYLIPMEQLVHTPTEMP